MGYADFQVTDDYVSKQSGSSVEVVLLDEADPGESIVSAVSSINWTDDFEVIPIEEAGQDGVDEQVQGRHSGSGTMQLFFSGIRNDRLPTRGTNIGTGYTVFERIGEDRANPGTVLNAFTGVKLSRVASSHGARGAKTMDLAFSYENRYNGVSWFAINPA